ncbi:hypothetical protein [Tenacibaculum geojense]|uniref:Uncharacterized protein n=1 Tax=Tenacibaculum geojense TaxID=915352 RepID=A0ABW3JRQ6_9FLAO
MHNVLIQLAFDKMKNDHFKNEGLNLTKTQTSKRLSELLLDDYKVCFGDKRLRDIYNNKAKIKQVDVLKALCDYLGYDNYNAFLESNNLNEKGRVNASFSNTIFKFKQPLLISLTVLICLIMVYFFTVDQQRWMVWKVDHYEEVDFDTKKYKLNQLKLFKEERINNFKKIEATCDTNFFDDKGNVKVWYEKNRNGKLDLFTSLGLHPETGKTLKPITRYMIKKYICKTY